MADLVVPQLGESITEAVIGKWLKQIGDNVTADEPVVELETDKVTVQLPSPVAGALGEQRAAVGATVKVGEIVGQVTAGAAGKAAAPKVAAVPAKSEVIPAAKAAPVAAPTPTPPPAPAAAVPRPEAAGPSKEDLLRLTPAQRATARESGKLPSKATASSASSGGPVDIVVDPRDEVVAMSPLRKRVAERLVQAQHESASLTTFNEVDMTAVMEMRAHYKDAFEKSHGTKLGFMSFFVKACVAAAKLFPGVNAEVAGGSIVYKKHYDFGIAVSAPKGLVVPVLRDCDTLDFAGIEKGIAALGEKARSGKLTIPEMVGGTFSITNGGIFGSMMSTPLLNFPQTGILGMHNIVKRAVVINDEIKIRPMMYIALTYDHRVVDGREAVSFLVAVKERLEAPDRLLLAL